MKKFRVAITEFLSKSVMVNANTEEEAENIVREKYNNGEITLDYGDYDNTVKFEAFYEDPSRFVCIAAKGWDFQNALYIHETFEALKASGVKMRDDEIFNIINESISKKRISVQSKPEFNMSAKDSFTYTFEDLTPGTYYPESDLYKTEDNKYVVEIKR